MQQQQNNNNKTTSKTKVVSTTLNTFTQTWRKCANSTQKEPNPPHPHQTEPSTCCELTVLLMCNYETQNKCIEISSSF